MEIRLVLFVTFNRKMESICLNVDLLNTMCGQIVGFLLATGVGAGFAVTYEFKKFFKELFKTLANAGFAVSEEFKSKVDKFLDRVYIAAGLLLLAFLCMVVLSVLSSVQRKNKN